MKLLILTLTLLSIFTGCTVKQFNENVDSITGDITRTLDEGIDKSAD